MPPAPGFDDDPPPGRDIMTSERIPPAAGHQLGHLSALDPSRGPSAQAAGGPAQTDGPNRLPPLASVDPNAGRHRLEAGSRSPQTVRIESDGLIIELCDDIAANRQLSRGANPGVAAGHCMLHLRIRSDGLLAQASLQIPFAAMTRFQRDLDDLIRLRHGEASLTGSSRHPSALRLDAETGKPRLTLLVCPSLATRVRVVIEAHELEEEDLLAIRHWVATRCAN